MAQRWRNVAANGEQGSVVRHRFLPTCADGWLDPSIDLTESEEEKMRLIPSWQLQDDGSGKAADKPTRGAEPVKAPESDPESETTKPEPKAASVAKDSPKRKATTRKKKGARKKKTKE